MIGLPCEKAQGRSSTFWRGHQTGNSPIYLESKIDH